MRYLLVFLCCVSSLVGCVGRSRFSAPAEAKATVAVRADVAAKPKNVAKTDDSAACHSMVLGQNTSLGGFVPFEAADAWNQDISGAAVDPNSNAILSFIGTATKLHPDFGAGMDAGGIPYQVVGEDTKATPLVPVTYNAYGDESDPGPMPIPANPVIEAGSDQHLLVVDRHNCFEYELFGAAVDGSGNVSAASGAVFDLRRDEGRPYTWTSADAAGLPVFPGLARYDEVEAGAIRHALRVTLARTRAAFVLPARHWAANSSNAYAAPMGMRLRLKASFDISGFTPQAKVVLTALKTYGLIVADNGSSMFVSGAPNDAWDNDDLHELTGVTAASFEVVEMGTVYTAANVPTGTAPAITSLSASLAPGGTTLTWTSPDATTTFFVTPDVGAVRGYSAVVAPSATTTYTLYATNDFGRTSTTITVAPVKQQVQNPLIMGPPSH